MECAKFMVEKYSDKINAVADNFSLHIHASQYHKVQSLQDVSEISNVILEACYIDKSKENRFCKYVSLDDSSLSYGPFYFERRRIRTKVETHSIYNKMFSSYQPFQLVKRRKNQRFKDHYSPCPQGAENEDRYGP
jgi:hypothetical protein